MRCGPPSVTQDAEGSPLPRYLLLPRASQVAGTSTSPWWRPTQKVLVKEPDALWEGTGVCSVFPGLSAQDVRPAVTWTRAADLWDQPAWSRWQSLDRRPWASKGGRAGGWTERGRNLSDNSRAGRTDEEPSGGPAQARPLLGLTLDGTDPKTQGDKCCPRAAREAPLVGAAGG